MADVVGPVSAFSERWLVRIKFGRYRARPPGRRPSFAPMSSGRRSGRPCMTDETLAATTTIAAPAEAVFAVLTDPASHPAIDGTGWVSKALDTAPLTGSGQIFRMGMYHANHPDGTYEVANRVATFEPPRAISWEPGQDVEGDGRATGRRLDLALRPGPPDRVEHGGHAHLRLVGRAVVRARVHHVPAVPRGPPHQLAAPPGRARHPAVAGYDAPLPGQGPALDDAPHHEGRAEGRRREGRGRPVGTSCHRRIT